MNSQMKNLLGDHAKDPRKAEKEVPKALLEELGDGFEERQGCVLPTNPDAESFELDSDWDETAVECMSSKQNIGERTRRGRSASRPAQIPCNGVPLIAWPSHDSDRVGGPVARRSRLSAFAYNLSQGQTGLLPTLKAPLIVVSLRIDTTGALTAMLSPSTIRFGPNVAFEVASRVCVPESV